MGFPMFQEWMFGNSVQLSEDSLQKDFLCSDKWKEMDYGEKRKGGAPEDVVYLYGWYFLQSW